MMKMLVRTGIMVIVSDDGGNIEMVMLIDY